MSFFVLDILWHYVKLLKSIFRMNFNGLCQLEEQKTI